MTEDRSVEKISQATVNRRLTCLLALSISWPGTRFEQFLREIDGDVHRWWADEETTTSTQVRALLPKKQRQRLDELRHRDCREVAEEVQNWPGSVILFAESGYPAGLYDLKAPPTALHVVGSPTVLQRAGLAIVGSRKIGVAAARSARKIMEPVARGGLVVVSGGALGADAVAHRCAVDVGGMTVSVLPTGLRNLSPRRNRRLFDDIVSGSGALVSEYLPDQGVRKYHFRRRNGLIAAMSRGVLVLRAAQKSGTMLTVDAARGLGRPLGAMPGTPEDPLSSGCHKIIRDGGRLIANAEDLKKWWRALVPEASKRERDDGGEESVDRAVLPECEVLNCAVKLTESGTSFSLESLARETGRSAAELQTVLLGHELSGVIERVPGAERFRFLVTH